VTAFQTWDPLCPSTAYTHPGPVNTGVPDEVMATVAGAGGTDADARKVHRIVPVGLEMATRPAADTTYTTPPCPTATSLSSTLSKEQLQARAPEDRTAHTAPRVPNSTLRKGGGQSEEKRV
jgi:hypothetical protein